MSYSKEKFKYTRLLESLGMCTSLSLSLSLSLFLNFPWYIILLRLLAVGGSDDNIQILQSREPKEPSTKPISSSSILNYCK